MERFHHPKQGSWGEALFRCAVGNLGSSKLRVGLLFRMVVVTIRLLYHSTPPVSNSGPIDPNIGRARPPIKESEPTNSLVTSGVGLR
ncbi:MAG TPA: hypothetical protein PLX89_24770, partial [Verrucomicrobiota bacterium]|nr:hypothetical protein [Verrucomicrobiota bacterium]